MMNIKILGTGCSKCRALEKKSLEALAELSIDTEVVKVTNVNEIMSYGVMMIPALEIDETVRVVGRVLSTAEIKRWIQEKLA